LQAAALAIKSVKSLVPLLDRVLVQRLKPETVTQKPTIVILLLYYQKTATGIFLPTSATTSPLPEAIVISVGPGAPNKDGNIVPPEVKAGDRVLLPGWGGNSIKVGEEVRLSESRGDNCLLFTPLPFRNTTFSKIRKSLQR